MKLLLAKETFGKEEKKMKSKITGIIPKNFGWKLLSLLFAITLWFVVMNINDPTEIKTFSVNLDLLNIEKLESNDFVALNEDELQHTKIDIKVRGTRSSLEELSKPQNRDRIIASIDFQQLSLLGAIDISEPIYVNTSVSLPSNLNYLTYEILSYSPSSVAVKLDNVVTVTKDVRLSVVGSPQNGYVNFAPNFNPEQITITGPESQINKISTLKFSVDISDAVSDVVTEIEPEILDEKGEPIKHLKLSDEFISVTVPISKRGEVKIAEPTVTGTPGIGYVFTEIEYVPKSVDVVGDEKGLMNVGEIVLEALDINGATNDVVSVIALDSYLSELGLSFRNNNEKNVKVTAKIVKEDTAIFNVPISNISVSGYRDGLNIKMEESIYVKLAAINDDLNTVKAEDLKGIININDLNEGTHILEVSINLPENIRLVEPATTKLTIEWNSSESVPAMEQTEEQLDFSEWIGPIIEEDDNEEHSKSEETEDKETEDEEVTE